MANERNDNQVILLPDFKFSFLQGLFFINPDSLNSFFAEVKPLIKNLQDKAE